MSAALHAEAAEPPQANKEGKKTRLLLLFFFMVEGPQWFYNVVKCRNIAPGSLSPHIHMFTVLHANSGSMTETEQFQCSTNVTINVIFGCRILGSSLFVRLETGPDGVEYAQLKFRLSPYPRG